MPRVILLVALVVGVFLPVADSAYAQATNRVSYVASYGSGTACTSTAPCRNLSDAIDATFESGTVLCLDNVSSSTGASGATISQSITIDCRDHRYNQYLGITINAATSSVVTIKGVHINSRCASCQGVGGIVINTARAVILEDVAISNQYQSGLRDQRSGGQTRLYIKDSTFNYNPAGGIILASQGTSATVLDNVSLLNNAYGIAAATGNNVVITRSTISGNGTAGVHADAGAQITVSNSSISHNTTNLNAYGIIRLKENEIQFSNAAIAGPNARSLGSNRFVGNASIGPVPILANNAPNDVYD